jgi:hypothetical protein
LPPPSSGGIFIIWNAKIKAQFSLISDMGGIGSQSEQGSGLQADAG